MQLESAQFRDDIAGGYQNDWKVDVGNLTAMSGSISSMSNLTLPVSILKPDTLPRSENMAHPPTRFTKAQSSVFSNPFFLTTIAVQKERKAFFSEEKKQKTFVSSRRPQQPT
jgi:hypothetical protein